VASPQLLIAPGEGADGIAASLAELEGAVSIATADPVAAGDGPATVARALLAYERQASRLAPGAAIVHGSGDRPLAAAISLVKLEIPLARVGGPGEGDLIGILASHTISPGESLAEQVRAWLRGLPPADPDVPGSAR
jgi:hypothetical protein